MLIFVCRASYTKQYKAIQIFTKEEGRLEVVVDENADPYVIDWSK